MSGGLTLDAIVTAVAVECGISVRSITSPGAEHTHDAEEARIMVAAMAMRHTTAGITRVCHALNVYGARLQRMLRLADTWKTTRQDFVVRAQRVHVRLVEQPIAATALLDRAPPAPPAIPAEIIKTVHSALSAGCTATGLCLIIRQYQVARLRAGCDEGGAA